MSITIFFLLSLTPTYTAAQQSLSYEAYLSLIGEIRGEALNAEAVHNSGCRPQLLMLANRLKAITQIVMPDGSTVAVDHTRAGLPTEFPFCDANQLIRFLNGICPPAVCLTTGEVVVPPDPLQNNPEDVTLSNLAEFTNAQAVVTAVPETSRPQPNPLLGAGTQQATEQEGVGVATAVSQNDDAQPTGEGSGASEQSITPLPGESGAAPPLGEASGEDAASKDREDVAAAATTSGEENTLAPQTADETGNGASLFRSPQSVWWLVGTGVVILLAVVGLAVYLQQQKAAPLRPETEKKVEEAVQTGRRLLTQGEYREAIRRLFNATLHILEDRGMLRFEQTRTNYELLNAVSTNPLLIPHLAPVIDAYDRVWYGYEPLKSDEFEALYHKIETLKQIQRQS